MTSEQFWESTPREFQNRLDGFIEFQNLKEKQEWERCRWMTEILANSTGNYSKPLKLSLPWDTNKVKKSLSKEEMQQIKEACIRAHGKTLDAAI
ncbi:MAG: hypothetical protein ACJ75J_18390 [Cytophagaceae bacterium]|jgi:hypothetical protein